MGSSLPSKRRPKLEPISLAELEADSTMVGFTSLFRIPTSEAALPHLVGNTSKTEDLNSNRQLETSVIDAVPVIETIPDIDTLPDIRTVSSNLTIPVIDTGTLPDIHPLHNSSRSGTLPVIDTVPDMEFVGRIIRPTVTLFHPKQLSGFGNKRIHRCVLAQDAHSHGEEALYQTLWKAGKPETDDTRKIAIGYGEMSKRIRLSFNNTKATCQRLIQKLALEEIAQELSHERIGKTYRVFSYKAILERRRAKGMEWVIRSKGVEFVFPTAFESEKPISGPLPDITNSAPLPVIDTVPITERDSMSISARGAPSITGPPLENSIRQFSREVILPSSSVVAIALSEFGAADDDAVHTILTACRRNAPDATPEEVAHFIREKGRVAANRKIGNPIGFLITYVPKCFNGEVLHLYRETMRRRSEADQQEAAEALAWATDHRRQQEHILADPNASEEDKSWARHLLGGEGN